MRKAKNESQEEDLKGVQIFFFSFKKPKTGVSIKCNAFQITDLYFYKVKKV